MLILQLAMALKRHLQETRLQAPPLEATAKIDARITRLFPFELTAGQRKAIDEIAADMARSAPMNRLLQGDVGSGKTVVAVYAMLLAVAHGCQAALMAPTEVLARQHVRTLGKLLHNSRVRMALLTGSLTAASARRHCRNWPRRNRCGHRHAGHRVRRGAVQAAGPGRDRRATQVRRAAAGDARNRPAPIRTTW